MWRTRAVISMLADEVAGLRVEREDGAPRESVEAEKEALTKARRSAVRAVVVDFVAIFVLFLARDGGRFLTLDASSVDSVFTLGVLAVAVHAGFRLGQLEKYRAVQRVCTELEEREGGG